MFVCIRLLVAVNASFVSPAGTLCASCKELGEGLDGTYADYVKLPARTVFAAPAQAAAFPLVFVTLWRMLITNAQLQPGESLLMIGIGGGIAKRIPPSRHKIGAQVIVTSGTHESWSGQGNLDADHSINHRKENLVAEVDTLTDHRGVDVVLDCVARIFGEKVWPFWLTGGDSLPVVQQ
jgi:NADPH:quinone reductase-like Zn-dependent oxidoreductase